METRRKLSEVMRGKTAKKIVCIETDEQSYSITEAANKYNLSIANLTACCKGRLKTVGKLHWRYV